MSGQAPYIHLLSLRESALIFNLFILLALEVDDAAWRGAGTSLSPSSWNLPLTCGPWDSPNVSQEKKRKKKTGPLDKYVFNKQ